MDKKIIYLAGGCFWGLQHYMDTEVAGVISTEVGYANGNTDTITYTELCSRETGWCETVKVVYDADVISLSDLLEEYYYTIDPTSLNRQGADIGTQYRTGIYYKNPEDRAVIMASLRSLQKRTAERVVVECFSLIRYVRAEEYHQKYLEKNPGGYCHININKIRSIKSQVVKPHLYVKKSDSELKHLLSPLQYEVTQRCAFEKPYKNEFWNFFENGIYTDITTGEPMFSSKDKFDAGDGYADFKKPIEPNVITILPCGDSEPRMLVMSRVGKSCLGLFIEDNGYYRINSAALKFIAEKDMKKSGYGYLC